MQARVREVEAERDQQPSAALCGDFALETLRRGRSEGDPQRVARPRDNDRAHGELVPTRPHRQDEPACVFRQAHASKRNVAARAEALRDLVTRERRVVAAPAQAGNVSRGEAEQRQAGRSLQPADVARQPQHRDRAHAGRQCPEASQRRGLQDRNEPRQIFAQDIVRRNRERRLVGLAALECRTVGLGEQREAETDDEERGRNCGTPGIAGKRQRGQAEGHGSVTALPLEGAEGRSEHARPQHGRDEDDQRRQHQQHGAGAAPSGKRPRISGATRERDHDCDQRSDRGSVHRRHGERAQAHRSGAEREQDDERRSGRDRSGQHEAAPGDDGMCEHRTRRDARTGGDQRADAAARRPADRRSGHCDDRDLRDGSEDELPAPRPEPRQPAPVGLGVAPEPGRHQNGEGEQQRRRLAADQQESTSGNLAGLVRGSQLGDQYHQVEAQGARLQRGSDLRHLPRERLDRPGMNDCGAERRRPRVAAIGRHEQRDPCEPVDTVRKQQRRRGGGVVEQRGAEHRRVRLASDQVPEGDRRIQRGQANADEPEAGNRRDRPGAPELKHFAAVRVTGPWQPPRA